RPHWEPTPEQAEAVLRLYAEGELSAAGVARRLGLPAYGVWRFLRSRGVAIDRGRGPRGRKPVAPERAAEGVRLYARGGLTVRGVAGRAGLSPSAVRKLLKTGGATRRGVGRPRTGLPHLQVVRLGRERAQDAEPVTESPKKK